MITDVLIRVNGKFYFSLVSFIITYVDRIFFAIHTENNRCFQRPIFLYYFNTLPCCFCAHRKSMGHHGSSSGQEG